MPALITPRTHLRCGYCHGEARGLLECCQGCGALLHADCRRELARCSTLGCLASSVQDSAPPAPKPPPTLVQRSWLWLVFLLVWGLFGSRP